MSVMMIQDEARRSLYQTTGMERLQAVQLGLLQLEQAPDEPAVLEILQQEMDSLKGESASLGLIPIASLTESIEDILIALQHQQIAFTVTVSDRLYQGLQTVGQLIHEATTGDTSTVDMGQAQADLKTVLAPLPLAVAVPTAEPLPVSEVPPALYIQDEELRSIYGTTCQGRLQTLDTQLQRLHQESVDGESWEILRREIHSLKGDSRAVGVAAIADIAEAVEEVIKDIQAGKQRFTPLVQDCLQEGLAAVQQLVQEAVWGEPSDVPLVQTLDHLLTLKTLTPPATLETAELPLAAAPLPPEESLAISAAPLIDDAELREIYRSTSEERLQHLEAGLLHLEKHPQDLDTLATLMREAHSLKGDARSAGVESVEALAHAVEDVLSGLQQGQLALSIATSDRLYQGLDAIGQLVQAAVTGTPMPVPVPELVGALRAIAPLPMSVEPAAPSATPPIAPGPASAPTLGETPEAAVSETVRVQSRDLDALMAQAEALAVNRIQIAQTATQAEQLVALWEDWKAQKHQPPPANAPTYEERLETLLLALKTTLQDNSGKLETVAEDLRERARKLQLLPLSRLFQPLPRMVRDLATQQSKAVNLVLTGQDLLADKRLLEGVKDALLHLVRNAIDHGVETPEERTAVGKPATAQLQVKAHQTALSLTLEITDDGRGLDLAKIKQTALKRGLFTREELQAMPPSQIQELILAPGFSTRNFITEISGRGVGLDVVRTQVEQLKGILQIESTPGQGCTFRIQLSTALSTVNVVLVETQGMTFALPVEFLQTSLLVTSDQIVTPETGQATIILAGQAVPVADLAEVLELSQSPLYNWLVKPALSKRDRRPCVLLSVGDEQAGFLVDRLITQQEVVSKPLSPLLKRVRNVSGTTLLGTGESCVILNPPDLLKSLQQSTVPRQLIPETVEAKKPVILLVEDSPPVRIQEQRLFEQAGYEVVTACHGLEGYQLLQTRSFDAVVSDVEMPFLDGLSLTAKIRQQSDYDNLPIVLVTTLDSDADRKRGADAGANAYIIKGRFNQEALLGALSSLI